MEKLLSQKDIIYKTVGNEVLKADLYRMPAFADKSPVFFYFHGGSWSGGDKQEPLIFPKMMKELTELGIVLVSVEYRLVRPGLCFPAPVDDCVDAIRYFIKNAAKYGLDPKRAFCGGMSAGAHLSMMSAFAKSHFGDFVGNNFVDYQMRALIDICGPVDLTYKIPVRGQDDIDIIFKEFLCYNKDNRAKLLHAASPLTYLQDKEPAELMPILAIHGTLDELVHHSQSLQLQEIYEKAGVPFELFLIENANHGFGSVAGHPPPSHNVEHIQATIVAFIKKHIFS